jgi:hypothetical protein
MDNLEERFLMYSALLVLCGTLSIFVGPTAGVWTFIQIATVIEIIYWITFDSGDGATRNQ